MDIYLVSSGEYSDYGIVGVYTNKALADHYVEVMNRNYGYENYRVEEWDVTDELPEPAQHLHLTGYVSGGERGEDHEKVEWFFPMGEYQPPACRTDFFAKKDHRWSPGGQITVQVHGTDLERVRKVFSEQMAQAVAEFAIIVERDGR